MEVLARLRVLHFHTLRAESTLQKLSLDLGADFIHFSLGKASMAVGSARLALLAVLDGQWPQVIGGSKQRGLSR